MSARPFVRRLALAALLLAIPRLAGAVCTAADITAVDASCPAGTGPCTISGSYTVSDGCTLDFGARAVGLTGKLTVANVVSQIPAQTMHVGTMTLRAGSLSLAQGGFIDAIGGGSGEAGGVVIIEVTNAFTSAMGSHIETSGNSSNTGAGTIIVRAGSILVAGKLVADFRNGDAAGGLIDLTADGDITLTSNSTVSAQGGSTSNGGGEIDLTAGGNLLVQTTLDVEGWCGGSVELRAEGTSVVGGIDASATGDAGSGGCIDVTGGTGTTITGSIDADGATGSDMSGGCGGLICLDGDSGTMTVAPGASVSANGASPDGGGGEISLLGLGSTAVNGLVQARGPLGGTDFGTCGGDVCIETGLDASVTASGSIDVSGSDAGGGVEIIAGRDVTIDGELDLRGRDQGALGGDAALRAGNAGTGQLRLNNVIDTSCAASCGVDNGCGQGGSTDLFGCNVTLTANSSLIATGPDGGQHNLAAREQLLVQGMIDARRTVATMDFSDGVTRIQHPARKPPNLAAASILPAPQVQALSTCPTEGPTMPSCLAPCPTCGNGQIEFPETCDLGVMPPTSCNGCSIFCQLEDCNDNLTCTGDQCLPAVGCRHRETPVCTEPPTPTPTVTGTLPTATSTATPSATRTATDTPTATATPVATATASATASRTPTATGSATVTATPTASLTATAVPTATPLDTATPIATASATATATAENTATATATATSAPPACAGDCNGDGTVAVNELITGVNIALGNSTAANCPSFDRNGDGSVSINELIAAVNAALNGC